MIIEDEKMPVRLKKAPRKLREAGNAIVFLFAAIAMAGTITYGLNNVMRGPGATSSEVTRKAIAENNLVASTRMSIAISAQQTANGDCDGDGFVEPLPYRDAGSLPKPTGGGLIPMTMGSALADPWGTQYGYCVWDPGTASVSNAIAACGGSTPRRLQGSPRDDQYAIAVISAGKNGQFETTCNAYVDASPADGKPDNVMLNKPASSDDIVLAYSYAEANGVGGGIWKLKAGDDTTAEVGKNIETTGNVTFNDGALELKNKGLVLPGDPGDDTVTGACDASKENQLRRNIGDGSEAPLIEICTGGEWTPISGGGDAVQISGSDLKNFIATGSSHTCGIGTDSKAYCWGYNAYGQIGDGSTTNRRTPTLALNGAGPGTYKSIMSSSQHICALGTDDKAYCWGYNTNGQIGDNTTTHRGAPTLVLNGEGPGTYKSIATGMSHTCGIGTDDKAYCWGNNAYEQIGDGTATIRRTPTLAHNGAGPGTYKFITVGGSYTCALGTDDKAYCWGLNALGALGDGTTTNRSTPTLALNGAGPGTYKSISAGYYGSCGIGTDDKAYCWGQNDSGQLGDNTTTNRSTPTLVLNGAGPSTYKSIAIGSGHACGIGNDDKAYCWGYNFYGAVGDNTTTNRSTPTLVLNGAGPGTYLTSIGSTPSVISITPDVVRGTAAHPLDVGLASHWKMDDGTGTTVRDSIGSNNGTFINTPVWTQGVNGTGALSFNKADRDGIQITGLMGSPAVGTIAAWVNVNSPGTNGTEIFSIGGKLILRADEVSGGNGLGFHVPSGASTWNSLASKKSIAGTGWHYIVATYDDANDIYKLYLDGSVVASNETAITLNWAGGPADTLIGRHVSAATYDLDGGIDDVRFYNRALSPGEVVDLSRNALSSSPIRQSLNVKTAPTSSGKIATGAFHACGIMPDSSAKCWGYNLSGELGIGSLVSQSLPVSVVDSQWSYIAGSQYAGGATDTTCAIKTDGTAWCWGLGSYGQRGDGSTVSAQSTPVRVSDGSLWAAISPGGVSTCGIKTDGSAWCWGYGTDGQLGNGASVNSSIPVAVSGTDKWTKISVGSYHACGIKIDGTAWCWGRGVNGSLGNGVTTASQSTPVQVSGPGKWVDISAGNTTACGIKTDGSAWCWGQGGIGMLGNGTTTASQNTPVQVSGEGAWTSISVGTYNSCGIKTDGSAWCWGQYNWMLGIGNSSATVRSTPAKVIGTGSWSEISVGSSFTCAMKTDGSAWCWGSNTYGQLGNGSTAQQITPVPVLNFTASALWSWNETFTTIHLQGSTQVGLNGNWMSDDGTSKFFGFTGPGEMAIRQPSGNAQLIVETTASSQPAQISFRAGNEAVPLTDYTTGVVAEWLFDNTSGTTATASVGGMNGALEGTPVWNPSGGRKGDGIATANGVLEFDATKDGRVAVTRNVSLEPAAITISMWVRPIGPQNTGSTVLSKAHTSNTGTVKESYGFRFTGQDQLAFVKGIATGSIATSAATVKPGAWTHVVGSFGATAPRQRIYVNGVLSGSGVNVSAISYDTSGTDNNLFFGAAGCATMPCQQYHGAIDDVRIYNAQLTDAQVFQIYKSQSIGMQVPATIGVDQVANTLEIGRNNASMSNSITSIVPDVAIGSTGNIAIGAASGQGRFDVSTGGVKIGYQEDCTAENAGTIRYDLGYGYLCKDELTNWTPRESSRNWYGLASSADGTKLAAAVAVSGQIYISTDSGATWTPRGPVGSYYAVASSADGRKLAAVMQGGQIYTSTDGGITWMPRETSRNWYGIASSADGTKLVATVSNGQIYTSTDSGATWTAQETTRDWRAVTSSADGTKLAAIVNNQQIYTSTDSGVTWTARDSNRTWFGITSSADGMKLAATAASGRIYTSIDSGVTWTPRDTNRNWRAIASSADGMKLVAGVFNGQLYTSSDAGVTWAARDSNRTWYTLASSADGRKVAAGVASGQIYTTDGCAYEKGAAGSSIPTLSCDSTIHKTIAAGAAGCGLDGTGAALCWGSNTNASVGDGTTTHRAAPVAVLSGSGPGKYKSLTSGSGYKCGIGNDEKVYCWGNNQYGQLGDGTSGTDRSSPVAVVNGAGPGTYKSVSGGAGVTCGIGSDSRAYCWGNATVTSKTLGTNATTPSSSPVAVLDGAGPGTYIYIAAGGSQVCGIGTDNRAYCWGYNGYGALGDGTTTTPSAPVAAINGAGPGTYKSLAALNSAMCGIGTNDKAYCWGFNGSYGALGDGTTTQRNAPVAVLNGAGPGSYKMLAAGGYSVCGIGTDDKAYCWGSNGNGQLGNGTTTSSSTPVAVLNGAGPGTYVSLSSDAGATNICGLATDGKIYCWGDGAQYKLGNGGVSDSSSPVLVQNGAGTGTYAQCGGADTGPWKFCNGSAWTAFPLEGGGLGFNAARKDGAISAGSLHGCAVHNEGTLGCWGYDNNGVIGNGGTTDPAVVPHKIGGDKWAQVSAGPEHSCAIKANGTLWCWGSDGMGQLGNGGTMESQNAPQQIGANTWQQTSAGTYHTCSIRDNGTLWCWGSDSAGQVGNGGTTSTEYSPVQVGTSAWTWISASNGGTHSCGVRDNGTLWCWGSDGNGELGNGATTGNQLAPVQVGTSLWTRVSAGTSHTCGIRDNGTLWCWGSDSAGQIGNDATTGNQVSPVQIGVNTWLAIAAGGAHTCGIRATNSTMWCWGSDAYGQLGNGATTGNQVSPVSVGADKWMDVTAGAGYTCGTKVDGSFWCWGRDNGEQLGNGEGTVDMASPARVLAPI